MRHGVLHELTLGYQLLWGPLRRCAGVQLRLEPQDGAGLQARHLLAALAAQWPAGSVPLLLGTSSNRLLADLLEQPATALLHLEVTEAQMQDAAIAQRVLRAGQRGLPLVWHGDPGSRFKAAQAASFAQSILNLDADQALMGLRIARRSQCGKQPAADPASPVQAGQICEGVASRMLADHVLGQQGAAALLGWPVDDVLYGYRQTRLQPGHAVLTRLIAAIDSDAPMTQIELLLGADPLLAYRFLRFANSAGAGLRRDIDALRLGLMVLGMGRLKSWAQEQLPRASSDRNLHPLRTSMVLRAHLMAELMDAGEGDALTRELYLCGLLSQIDVVLAEPMSSAFNALPLSERLKAALLSQDGPYWPYLAIANALEQPDTAATRALCQTHEQEAEAVNLALLRALAAVTAPTH